MSNRPQQSHRNEESPLILTMKLSLVTVTKAISGEAREQCWGKTGMGTRLVFHGHWMSQWWAKIVGLYSGRRKSVEGRRNRKGKCVRQRMAISSQGIWTGLGQGGACPQKDLETMLLRHTRTVRQVSSQARWKIEASVPGRFSGQNSQASGKAVTLSRARGCRAISVCRWRWWGRVKATQWLLLYIALHTWKHLRCIRCVWVSLITLEIGPRRVSEVPQVLCELQGCFFTLPCPLRQAAFLSNCAWAEGQGGEGNVPRKGVTLWATRKGWTSSPRGKSLQTRFTELLRGGKVKEVSGPICAAAAFITTRGTGVESDYCWKPGRRVWPRGPRNPGPCSSLGCNALAQNVLTGLPSEMPFSFL